MNKFVKKRILGFTIIELMIVLVIVALLLSLAYPSYIKYVRKSKRGEAQQMLLNWSINQEIWRSNHTAYALPGQMPVPCSGDGADCDYAFTSSNVTAASYTLTATARSDSDQQNDTYKGVDCSSMSLTQNGVKSPPGCWE
jgi:type IV pilus assembly protein PilE